VNDELERGRILQAQHLAAAAAAHRDRRERIATAAMAGLLADESTGDTTHSCLAKIAVKAADALIAELDKEVQP
jgi:hypothetical protein